MKHGEGHAMLFEEFSGKGVYPLVEIHINMNGAMHKDIILNHLLSLSVEKL